MKSIHDLTFVLAGAGGRGRMFAEWVHENVAPNAIVAVAEPNAARRRAIAEMCAIPEERQFESWQDLLSRDRFADALINTTMDREHVASACQAMRRGYHMLLEKPMATNLPDQQEIDRVRRQTGRIVSVCHSLRYHAVYDRVYELLREGIVGEVVSIDQLEAVEHIHQSHSFVRGNWGNEGRSAFMLLAKSCHDIDIIAGMVPEQCLRVSSFGSLRHFRRQDAPQGAPLYCVEGCPVGEECPYHAMKVYGPDGMWREHAGFSGLTREQTLLKLRESPFGVCVYRSDNDVVDHQVVSMEFDRGVTATFTMTAFTPWGGRYVRVHGTKGYIEAKSDQRTIDVWEFWAGNRHTHMDIPEEAGGHGGADGRVMRNLLEALRREDDSVVRTGTAESLRTGTITFAAELARREGRVVEIEEFASQLSPV